MSKQKTVITTEYWEWDESENDWVPQHKVVKTEESEQQNRLHVGGEPWSPHRYTYPSPWQQGIYPPPGPTAVTYNVD